MRRWHFWACFIDKTVDAEDGSDNPCELGQKEIQLLKEAGYKAKIWAPLPQHKTSGHVHVVILCTVKELLKLAGIEDRQYLRVVK